MNKMWLKGLRNKLNSKAPLIEADGVRQSRRLSGGLSFTAEIKAYESVICYIQKGLGIYVEIISDIIKAILNFQGSAGQTHYSFHLFSFGWDDNKLHHNKTSIPIISSGNKTRVIKQICELAGKDLSDHTALIPVMFPPSAALYSRKSKVSNKDLLVFICKDRTIKLSESSKITYNKVKRRSLWVFINENVPEWEFGTFKPELIETSQ